MICLKRLLKKFFPPPVNAFNREVERILSSIQNEHKINDQNYSDLIQKNVVLQQRIDALEKTIIHLEKTTEQLKQNGRESTQSSEQIMRSLQDHTKIAKELRGIQLESLWGNIFRDTIAESVWLKNRCFSPGRWAAGYPFLYILYRVLNDVHPKRILELGLGQTTHMIGQYADAFDDVQHMVVEHDSEWISFFKRSSSLGKNTHLLKLELEESVYLEDQSVLSYQDFAQALQGKKFDLISIDGPFGGAAKIYSRVDTLRLLPECLSDSFVILLDDTNRGGEQRTAARMEQRLKDSRIDYKTGRYVGQKETRIWTSEDWRFLCSL